MNNTKLIIVEGLPGSGKRTTANLISEQLCKKGKKVVCVDEGMPDYQGKMIGTMLYYFAEKYIQSTLKDGWKVAINLRASAGKEEFYRDLGFCICPYESMGSGMEKMITND
ncbi:hypothetical protein [Anaerobium acetethylicum]|uniref:Chromatin associated protein KTI12 n=1 Tax=Anaerobium acetethylicum TaxID=1619234 RepID=A0A1D3TV20_9FIRM|nr:hypothetical protein [Anaerobium acetethylicum]SCP97926.1 Chromatin associated protein KTI12 [Anaerobium acetethylicum]